MQDLHRSPQIKANRSVNKTPGGGMGEIVCHAIHKHQPLYPRTEEEETFIEQQSQKQQNKWGTQPDRSTLVFSEVANRPNRPSPICTSLS